MKKINFRFLDKIADRDIGEFREVIKNKGLCRYLWIEFLLNPGIVRTAQEYLKKTKVKNELLKAISWYFAFKWIFKKNPEIERLKENKILSPYSIRGEIYRRERRNFLKGIIYAGLC